LTDFLAPLTSPLRDPPFLFSFFRSIPSRAFNTLASVSSSVFFFFAHPKGPDFITSSQVIRSNFQSPFFFFFFLLFLWRFGIPFLSSLSPFSWTQSQGRPSFRLKKIYLFPVPNWLFFPLFREQGLRPSPPYFWDLI